MKAKNSDEMLSIILNIGLSLPLANRLLGRCRGEINREFVEFRGHELQGGLEVFNEGKR